MPTTSQNDLICFSHLRWDFVFQRPQHLMRRFANTCRVFYVEEPIFHESHCSTLRARVCPATGVTVVTPMLALGQAESAVAVQQGLLKTYCELQGTLFPTLWFYTPMALPVSEGVPKPGLMIYDCMDELSMFAGAASELPAMERKLMERCDLVFTGGRALYEGKRDLHKEVYCFPSGVDLDHFSQGRRIKSDPADQVNIPHPRFGYAGVIDERMDLEFLAGIATARPDWQFVMVGPVVKIAPDSLPRLPNIHWLGKREYKELPEWFSQWDVAFMPFALNDSTRFISPTKTPEFLAAGLPVISTPITDVVRPYGEMGMAGISATVGEFVELGEAYLSDEKCPMQRKRTDQFLATQSWDAIWSRMSDLIGRTASVEARVA